MAFIIEECLPKSIEGIFGILKASTKHFGQNRKNLSGPFFYDVISKMAAIFGALKYMIFLNGKHISVSNVLYRFFWGEKCIFGIRIMVQGHI